MKDSGKTVFLTTHNMYVADELCDRVAFLVEGAMRLAGNTKELKTNMGKRIVKVEYSAGGSVEIDEFPLEGEVKQVVNFFESSERGVLR